MGLIKVTRLPARLRDKAIPAGSTLKMDGHFSDVIVDGHHTTLRPGVAFLLAALAWRPPQLCELKVKSSRSLQACISVYARMTAAYHLVASDPLRPSRGGILIQIVGLRVKCAHDRIPKKLEHQTGPYSFHFILKFWMGSFVLAGNHQETEVEIQLQAAFKSARVCVHPWQGKQISQRHDSHWASFWGKQEGKS